ncbi:LysR family transcriptional regulator [Mesorhizobium sp. WSM3866]|uniref:LysR substrate-binding domain-containing protein n=1 Tax=Mesorhizobium sp. WSM3866 TaxID=422271 RepID=UPI000BAFFC09|nr:LysR substrate-binding domain-containing protein [Mesorhizobium sp. WSM3866]PBB39970.1 LysR family transcriptional regulator [Mesorhizobium sp. WSM3866]
MTTLAVFAATARNANFKSAADEMNVTAGAVSRQIKALEDELGLKLFIRHKDGVQLTAAGQDLFSEVAASLSRCSEAVQALRIEKNEEIVTIGCTDAFATHWLMPRMEDFWAKFPQIVVNHFISDQVRDFRNAEVDLFVRPAAGIWPNESTEALSKDLIYPVCGVAFAENHRFTKPADLSGLPLLHVDWNNPYWPRWHDFLQNASVPYQGLRGSRFNRYSALLTAAEANQGLALGWDSLVRPMVHQGRLVRFSDVAMRDPVGFCLAWNNRKPLSKPASTMRGWLLDQAHAAAL